MAKSNNLQELVLNQVRREQQTVTLIVTNGFQLHGRITGFDDFTVLVESDGKQQLVYKHAISTILTEFPVQLPPQKEKLL